MKYRIMAFSMAVCLAIAFTSFKILPSKPDALSDKAGSDDQSSDPRIITIVNMIPASRSDETSHDSEPNIAVNPRNPNIIAASAFTYTSNRDVCGPSPCVEGRYPACKAPVYLSLDGGLTWHLKEVLESNNGITHDISVAFGPSGHLYASFLEGCFAADNVMKGFMTMRSRSPVTESAGSSLFAMDTIDTRFWRNTPDSLYRNIFDQPWVTTTSNGTSDCVFIGVNRVGASISYQNARRIGGDGKTARVIVSQSGTNRSFLGVPVEKVRNQDRNLSAIRVAAHPNRKVYAIFYRWISGGTGSGSLDYASLHPTCDVIVVRDDNFGRRNFEQLLNAGAGSSVGKRIASGIVPLSKPRAADPALRLPPGSFLGRARLVGSNLSIAVDPRNENHVVVAYCTLAGEVYTLHTKESHDAGVTWTALFPDIPNSMNPALAIADDGTIGLLYQHLTTGERSQWWETHFKTGAGSLSASDYMLNRFPNDSLPVLDVNSVALRPSLGDYVDLEAVGNTFYGVFSAFNMPDRESYSSGTLYQRGYSGSTFIDGSVSGRRVRYSVDPFFFKVEPGTGALNTGR